MAICKLCNGLKQIWGHCCSGSIQSECGCMGLPVIVDCNVCKGTGQIPDDKVDDDKYKVTEKEIQEQKDCDDWFNSMYNTE